MKFLRNLMPMAAALGLAAAAPGTAAAQTEIQWWHAMGGALGEWVNDLSDGFNKSQSDYRVVPVNKGNYAETMTAAIAAFRSGKPPHVLQVFEVGTATMMSAKGAVKPVYQLMAEAGAKFDPSVYLSAVTGYYTTNEGQMLSLPFNSSTPVFYYNKDAFKKAGLDPEKPPKTWPEAGEYARKLVEAGYGCGYSTSWQSWVHLENFSAWHNVPFASKANGFGGLDTEAKFNTPLHVKHVEMLQSWVKDKRFVYSGRKNEGNAKFVSGECAMYTESSGGYATFKKGIKNFEFGIAMLPYWPDVAGAPQNSTIGGASLWVMAGHKADEYKGVAALFNYLSSPEVQAASHQRTGYLPITMAAHELTRQQGFYTQNPGTETSILQMTHKPPTENSKGVRLGNFVQIRDVIDEELEAVWAGTRTAQQGLDMAVERTNKLLRQFEKDNR